jgi:outer membrane protein OmpA-like peptidoglycan-associated protein
MDIRQLAELRLTGYTFEDGTPFYEKLGEERAAALLKALLTHGYRIVSLAARRVSSTPSDDDAQRTARAGRRL